MGWYEQRFTERPGAIHKTCAACRRDLWFPPSKAKLYKTCGRVCNTELARQALMARARLCETCGSEFYPRQVQLDNGDGRFCSQKCNKPFHHASQAPDVWARRIETMRKMRANGEWTVMRGQDHPMWAGGKEAQRKRRAAYSREYGRKWRSRNREKAREFSKRRRGRLLGRLEKGSVKRIYAQQRGRCAICRTSIKSEYHIDHIIPVSKGGEHIARNIQLLCPPCNMRKSNKDQIDYMQSIGRLL